MNTYDSRLPEELKNKLKNAKVAIAGLGGLGSNIAVMLARAGIGKLFLVDFDTVDASNLNRQVYSIPHLGMKKTDALTSVIRDINPDIEIEAITTKVTSQNAVKLFGNYDIVCEAFDKADNKAMLISTLLANTKSTIVSGNGMAGYGNSNAITTKKPMNRLYTCGDGVTDVSCRILTSARVAICAGHQANKIIELILDKGD